jgi:hypothetical protein
MLSSVFVLAFGSAKKIKSLLGFVLPQFPIHAYKLVALWTANQELMDTVLSCFACLKGQ